MSNSANAHAHRLIADPKAARARLKDIIAKRSFGRGEITLASGRKSDFYFNLKPTMLDAELEHDFPYRTDRPTYHPARLRWQGRWTVQPVPWFGAPDLRGVTHGNAFVVFRGARW